MAKSKAGDKTRSPLKEFRTLLPYLRRYRLKYAMGFLCLLAVDAAQVVIPQFLRRAVDIISDGGFRIAQVLVPALSMIGLMGLVSLGRFFWRYFIHGSARRIETEIRKNLFDHLLSLSYDFYQKNKIGDLMARATNDLNAVRESIGMGLVALIDGTLMTAAILVIIFLQDTRTAAWAVLPLPLITLLILFFGKAIGRRFRRAYEAYSALSDAVQETFAGIRVIKSFVKEWWFIKKFAGMNDNYRDANMGLVKLFGVFFPFVSFLSGLTVLIVLLVGGIRVTQGIMSPGDLVALFRYLQMLIWPLMGAGFVVNLIERGAVCLGRVNEVMRTVPAIRSPEMPARSSAEGAEPLILLRKLSFEFPGGTKALDDINLTIKKGTVTGILGRTGAGKTTLIKAVTRMIDPPPGTVFIKGVESAAWDLPAMRRLFAVTPQDSYLFSDSIKNNIAYGLDQRMTRDSPAAPCAPVRDSSDDRYDEILKQAAAIAALQKDFPVFRTGWDTLIGERGLTLSGGQKQRTAIARSIAAEREILILDDSLSSVDAETEKSILDGLFELGREKARLGKDFTMIIVSHRVSALGRADEVIVLEKGKIVEQGSPSELAARGGFYARTAALQRLGGEHFDSLGGERSSTERSSTERSSMERSSKEPGHG